MLNESTLDFFQSNPYYFLPNLPRLLAATFNFTTFLFRTWISHVQWIIDFLIFFKNTTFNFIWLEFLWKNLSWKLSFSERWKSNQCLVFFEIFLLLNSKTTLSISFDLISISVKISWKHCVMTFEFWNAFSWASLQPAVCWLAWQPRVNVRV